MKKSGGSRDGGVTRRTFLAAGLASAAAISLRREVRLPEMAEAGPLSVEEMGIAKMQAEMAAGRLTSAILVRAYLERIEQIDRSGPALRSILELNPDAMSIAETLDAERARGRVRGPLHGIPLVVKDNIDTGDRMETSAGSLVFAGAKPGKDAFLVARLRAAGAVILAKTNLSEWANLRSPRSTSGWSARGGLTRNPYVLDRNTSGSSSGSGVAVSANLCAAGIGTETDGSIVSPSSINGIVGIKPTVGLVSRTGIIPLSHTQDTAGPMARTVRDAATLLGVIAGRDEEDAATSERPQALPTDYTSALDPQALRGARIGVVRKYFGFHHAVDEVMDRVLATVRREGAVLVDPVEIASIGAFDEPELTVLLYELKADLAAYLARRGAGTPVKSLAEVIAFNRAHADKEMPFFRQEFFERAETKGPLTDKEYLTAVATCRKLALDEGINAVMEKHQLDALLAPTDGPAWPTDLVDGDHFIGGSSSLAAVARCPSITVPAGRVFGLPVGVSFFGRRWSEAKLIGLAYAYEQATHQRVPPTYLPTIGME